MSKKTKKSEVKSESETNFVTNKEYGMCDLLRLIPLNNKQYIIAAVSSKEEGAGGGVTVKIADWKEICGYAPSKGDHEWEGYSEKDNAWYYGDRNGITTLYPVTKTEHDLISKVN